MSEEKVATLAPKEEGIDYIVDIGARKFAETTAQALEDMLSIKCKIGLPILSQAGLNSNRNLYVAILFTGSFFGEFIFALDEKTAASVVGKPDAIPGPGLDAVRSEIADTFGEVLNMVSGQSLTSLITPERKLTITAPKVHFGPMVYPRVKTAKVVLTTAHGEIECHIAIDRMRLDLAESYKGALSSLVAANHDLKSAMSKLQEQQIEMSQSEKMAALGKMAAGVAHEINTPLATISLVEQQMKGLLAKKDPASKEALVGLLDIIDQTVKRVSTITQSLRIFATKSATKTLQIRPVRDVIREGYSLCEASYKNDGISIELTGPALDSNLECNFGELAQVFFQLFKNSRDAVRTSPVKWVRVEATEAGDQIRLAVTDSGIQVRKDLRDKIFDPFFTTKDFGQGTGLGLSFSKGVVEMHRGALTLNSESPATQFVINIPKKQAVAPIK